MGAPSMESLFPNMMEFDDELQATPVMQTLLDSYRSRPTEEDTLTEFDENDAMGTSEGVTRRKWWERAEATVHVIHQK